MATSRGIESPEARIVSLQRRDLRLADQLVVDGGHGILPQLRLRNPGAEVAGDGPHVAVEQLVPGLRERVGELVGVLVEAPRDRLVDRIDLQRQVGGEHHRRVPLRRVVRVRHRLGGLGILRRPLLGAGGALRQLPVVLEEVLEEAVVPRRRLLRPGALETARERVDAVAVADVVSPAEALLLDRGGLRLRAEVLRPDCTVGLAERVAADDQRDGLLVVHRHPAEGLADVPGGGKRVRVAVRPLGVDVDQAHLHGCERSAEIPVAAVALVSEPRVLGPPEDLLRLPDVLAPEAEAERLESHRLHRDVAGVDQEIGPGELPAVALLDRPEQPARLVEADVVGPAVQRREALCSLAAAAAAVGDAVGARGVPAHPDEERAVVAVVGGPPVLRGLHHLDEVALQRLEVEARERLAIVVVLAQRVREGRVPVEDAEVELIRPPVPVRPGTGRLRGRARDDRVLALADAFGHVDPFFALTAFWLPGVDPAQSGQRPQ